MKRVEGRVEGRVEVRAASQELVVLGWHLRRDRRWAGGLVAAADDGECEGFIVESDRRLSAELSAEPHAAALAAGPAVSRVHVPPRGKERSQPLEPWLWGHRVA
eukprot:1037775-Pleurochrysis_carterae.AAC.1